MLIVFYVAYGNYRGLEEPPTEPAVDPYGFTIRRILLLEFDRY